MDWLEDFMGLFPLLVFIITIVIDKSSRRKRKAKRGIMEPIYHGLQTACEPSR